MDVLPPLGEPDLEESVHELEDELRHIRPSLAVPRACVRSHVPLAKIRLYVNGVEDVCPSDLATYVNQYIASINEQVINHKCIDDFQFCRDHMVMYLSNWHIAYLIHRANCIDDPHHSYAEYPPGVEPPSPYL